MGADAIIRLIGQAWNNQTANDKKDAAESAAFTNQHNKAPGMAYGSAPQMDTSTQGPTSRAAQFTTLETPEMQKYNPLFAGFMQAENNQLSHQQPNAAGGFSIQPLSVDSSKQPFQNSSAPTGFNSSQQPYQNSAMGNYLRHLNYRGGY